MTETLATTSIPGARSIWADPLYEGPVPAVSDEELVEIRTRFLLGSDAPDEDRWNDLRRWRDVIDDHRSYDELVLWFEHDLFDQLNLIQLLSWLRSRVPGARTVSVICIGSFPGRPDFHGLGELTAPELESLFDARRPVSDAEYAVAERAWQAFRQPTPLDLDEFRHSNTSAMPFLSRALERFLEEFPSTHDGLSRSERRLLQVAEQEVPLSRAFRLMHEGEDAYYVSDESFMELIDQFSRTGPPLGLVAGGILRLTDEGRAVLAGQRDRVAYGLDRWMGGVHLKTGETDMWRWDENERRVKLTSANPSSRYTRSHS